MPESPIVRAVRCLEIGEWQTAHEIAQQDASSVGCWVHGIVHLVEGDLENAKYWYGRAHRTLPRGATAAAEIAALRATLADSPQ